MNSHPNEDCEAVEPGGAWAYTCTRPKGHSGPHAAAGITSGPYAMWRQV